MLDVKVEHILAHCAGTVQLYDELLATAFSSSATAPRLAWPQLRMQLFADRISHLDDVPERGETRIQYVGRCIQTVASEIRQQQQVAAVNTMISHAASLDLDRAVLG